eukprot:14417862-Alexandrium_andersonii.AAC.1
MLTSATAPKDTLRVEEACACIVENTITNLLKAMTHNDVVGESVPRSRLVAFIAALVRGDNLALPEACMQSVLLLHLVLSCEDRSIHLDRVETAIDSIDEIVASKTTGSYITSFASIPQGAKLLDHARATVEARATETKGATLVEDLAQGMGVLRDIFPIRSLDVVQNNVVVMLKDCMLQLRKAASARKMNSFYKQQLSTFAAQLGGYFMDTYSAFLKFHILPVLADGTWDTTTIPDFLGLLGGGAFEDANA